MSTLKCVYGFIAVYSGLIKRSFSLLEKAGGGGVHPEKVCLFFVVF